MLSSRNLSTARRGSWWKFGKLDNKDKGILESWKQSTMNWKHSAALWTRYIWRRRRAVLGILILVLCIVLLHVYRTIFTSQDPCLVLEQHTPRIKNSRLPKIIHQQWPRGKPFPKHSSRWFQKWNELFPDVEHRLWSDEEMRELIAKDFPFFLKTYDGYPHAIMRVDAARTFILYKYGGVYVDMDYEPLTNFWDRLPDDRPSLVQSYWSHEPVQNSLMTSPPNHAFWNLTWQIMTDRDKEKTLKPIELTLYLTGPMVVETARVQWDLLSPDHPVTVLPCENWQRLSIGYQHSWGELASRAWQLGFARAYRVCGPVYDHRCQMCIHHGTTAWTGPLKA